MTGPYLPILVTVFDGHWRDGRGSAESIAFYNRSIDDDVPQG